jgi:hypothetical protein
MLGLQMKICSFNFISHNVAIGLKIKKSKLNTPVLSRIPVCNDGTQQGVVGGNSGRRL